MDVFEFYMFEYHVECCLVVRGPNLDFVLNTENLLNCRQIHNLKIRFSIFVAKSKKQDHECQNQELVRTKKDLSHV